MPALTSYLAAAAVVAAAGSAYEQNQAASAQRKTQKKQNALQRAAEAFQNTRNARIAVAQARVKQAQALAIGEAQGASGSSAVGGAVGAIGSQTAGAIGSSQALQSAQAGIGIAGYKGQQDIDKFTSASQTLGVLSKALSSASAYTASMPSGTETPTQLGTPQYLNSMTTPYQGTAGNNFSFSNYASAWGRNPNLLGQSSAYFSRARGIY